MDFNVLVRLQDRTPHFVDNPLATIVDLGSMEIQGFILLIAVWLLPVKKRVKILIFTSYCVGLGMILVGKTYLAHPAPPYMFHRGNAGLSFPSLHVQVQSSYPSGHTYRTVFLASLLSAQWLIQVNRQKRKTVVVIASILLALLTMTGMVILGKHWVSDVVGGGLLAVGVVSGVYAVLLAHIRNRPGDFTDR